MYQRLQVRGDENFRPQRKVNELTINAKERRAQWNVSRRGTSKRIHAPKNALLTAVPVDHRYPGLVGSQSPAKTPFSRVGPTTHKPTAQGYIHPYTQFFYRRVGRVPEEQTIDHDDTSVGHGGTCYSLPQPFGQESIFQCLPGLNKRWDSLVGRATNSSTSINTSRVMTRITRNPSFPPHFTTSPDSGRSA